MLLNTVMEGKTSPCLGHTLPMNNPEDGDPHPWGNGTTFLPEAEGRLM